MKDKFTIQTDISKAETLPASFYRDKDLFESVKEKIFLKSLNMQKSVKHQKKSKKV